MINRPHYLTRLDRHRDTGLVKVLVGMRRTGKSAILRSYRDKLQQEGVDKERLVSLNLEIAEHAGLRDANNLLAYVRERRDPTRTTYVFIDEAQEAVGIGKVVYTLAEEGCYDLYLTGSHTRLIERELSGVLAGRFVEIPVFSLSFVEYLELANANGQAADRGRLFNQYLQCGGLPSAMAFSSNPYALHEYLDGVYHTVLRRDVAASLGKEDPVLLDAIIRLLTNSLGQPVSANGISKTLVQVGHQCSDDTVSRYLDALVDAHAFYRVRRFDLKSKTLLKTQERYYLADLGFRNLALGTQQAQLAGLLENVVYLELRRRHSEVHVGKHYARHICFVTHDAQGTAYYQVATSVLDPAALDRALAPLRAERDNYPKTLLTLDEVGMASHEGIAQRNVIDWLVA
ncbi:MAG: ATP-binding protein [Coriobacteriales bacterium]|nr:ATP-binding protein [Coriobacteriales bacterium]